mmetsp:Transcript_52692/g.140527  ORF Transcript_52692/g.140527 Transcript_52692/m.140527 type:complete len:354 (+) Transcript_52692:565-1626(+)
MSSHRRDRLLNPSQRNDRSSIVGSQVLQHCAGWPLQLRIHLVCLHGLEGQGDTVLYGRAILFREEEDPEHRTGQTLQLQLLWVRPHGTVNHHDPVRTNAATDLSTTGQTPQRLAPRLLNLQLRKPFHGGQQDADPTKFTDKLAIRIVVSRNICQHPPSPPLLLQVGLLDHPQNAEERHNGVSLVVHQYLQQSTRCTLNLSFGVSSHCLACHMDAANIHNFVAVMLRKLLQHLTPKTLQRSLRSMMTHGLENVSGPLGGLVRSVAHQAAQHSDPCELGLGTRHVRPHGLDQFLKRHGQHGSPSFIDESSNLHLLELLVPRFQPETKPGNVLRRRPSRHAGGDNEPSVVALQVLG